MSQETKQDSNHAGKCLECEEKSSWTYSYQEMPSVAKSQLKPQSQLSPSIEDLPADTKQAGLVQHNWHIGKQRVEVMTSGQLFDLKIHGGQKKHT